MQDNMMRLHLFNLLIFRNHFYLLKYIYTGATHLSVENKRMVNYMKNTPPLKIDNLYQ